MNRVLRLAVVAMAALLAGAGGAQAQFPIVDAVAERVVQKYQSASCEQLWERRGKHGPEEQRAIEFLRNDPQMRREFFNKIAGPVVNKMFECGMIP
jgi:thioesterase domain-containing protein